MKLVTSILASTAFMLLSLTAYASDSPLRIETQPKSCQLDSSHTSHESLKDCTSLAELGYAQAQFDLGHYWYDLADYTQALHWFTQASVQGNIDAQLLLGHMYAEGQGVTANKTQAFIIYKMAAVNGSDEALNRADTLAQTMSEDELKRSNQILAQIFKRYLQHIQKQGAEFNSLH